MVAVSAKPTARKCSFLFRITLVNVNKSVGDCGLNVNFVSQYLFSRNIISTRLFPMFPFDSLATKRANENDFLFPLKSRKLSTIYPKMASVSIINTSLPEMRNEQNGGNFLFDQTNSTRTKRW